MAQITLVSHNSYLFRGTVEENLRMGDPEASQAQMRIDIRIGTCWLF